MGLCTVVNRVVLNHWIFHWILEKKKFCDKPVHDAHQRDNLHTYTTLQLQDFITIKHLATEFDKGTGCVEMMSDLKFLGL